ncbi:protein phosphatase regulator [Recurvomyces mirabilis]|nr:protein phosphatase regulator [Recurvomyces mirabilis]
MSRPGGPVRADTLDLQDHDNPSAAEHQRHPGQNGVAPHQASQLNHVSEERHSEEQSLHEAWNLAGKLTEDPGAIAEAQANHENGNATNGTQQDGEEGGEGGESEAEGDDDMMDRISSSPSIDDGWEGATEDLARQSFKSVTFAECHTYARELQQLYVQHMLDPRIESILADTTAFAPAYDECIISAVETAGLGVQLAS